MILLRNQRGLLERLCYTNLGPPKEHPGGPVSWHKICTSYLTKGDSNGY